MYDSANSIQNNHFTLNETTQVKWPFYTLSSSFSSITTTTTTNNTMDLDEPINNNNSYQIKSIDCTLSFIHYSKCCCCYKCCCPSLCTSTICFFDILQQHHSESDQSAPAPSRSVSNCSQFLSLTQFSTFLLTPFPLLSLCILTWIWNHLHRSHNHNKSIQTPPYDSVANNQIHFHLLLNPKKLISNSQS